MLIIWVINEAFLQVSALNKLKMVFRYVTIVNIYLSILRVLVFIIVSIIGKYIDNSVFIC